MNATYYQDLCITTKQVYNLDVIPIPDGYDAYEFRPPNAGERFLSTVDAMRGGKTSTVAAADFQAPRIILRKEKTPTTVGVYGTTPKIPEGYLYKGFRALTVGDLYLSIYPGIGPCIFQASSSDAHTGEWRIILEKIVEKIVRVVRVLEYIGPESWIKTTFANNGVGPSGPQVPVSRRGGLWIAPQIPPDRSIRELSVFQEEVTC